MSLIGDDRGLIAAAVSPITRLLKFASALGAFGRLAPAFWLGLALSGAAHGQDGWYVTPQLGAGQGFALSLNGGDNDRAARCDEFVNPRYAELPGCRAANRGDGAVDDWGSEFDAAGATTAGIVLGRRFGGRYRIEIEYLRADAGYDESSAILSPSGAPFTGIFGPELPLAHERVGTVSTQGLLLNLRVDFPLDERFALFAGAGAGFARTRMNYNVIWARSLDPATVQTAAGLPNESEVRANLAGTVSSAAARLDDDSFAYQILAGISYAWSATLAVDLQFRWLESGDLFSGGHAYDRLRSHASNLRRDGSEPVAWQVGADGLGFRGISLGLRYALP